ncbi:hypothetical protein [Ottowia sp. VDI28]|uniref:hypothetical protein n=1 Tax=Ottowia sp. VDI28 TaxID=3133968 RepID=UPI003C2C4178
MTDNKPHPDLPESWAEAVNLARNISDGAGEVGIPTRKGAFLLARAILDMDATCAMRAGEPKCLTCNGHGMIGGLLPGDGGYDGQPCPECNTAPPTVVQAAPAAVAGPIAWLRNERGVHARGKAVLDPLCILGPEKPSGYTATYQPVYATPTTQTPAVAGPSEDELLKLSRACEKMPGGMGMYYKNFALAVLARWGAAPTQTAPQPAAHQWDTVLHALWVLTEHNALHFGENHNTVIQGRAALATQPQEAAPAAAWEIRFRASPASVELTPFPGRAEEAKALGFEVHELVRRVAAPYQDALTKAAKDVLAERLRQINVEGWTPDHDDEEHLPDELALAAASYVCADAGDAPPAIWPWDRNWWKPRDRRRNLVKSGALILAELERLDRAGARAQQEGK